MRVPASASQALSPRSPICGEPAEAHAAAGWLSGAAQRLERYCAATSSAQSQLRSNISGVTARLDSKLETASTALAAALATQLRDAQGCFARYAGRVSLIHGDAAAVLRDVDEQLNEYRLNAFALEEICAEIGAEFGQHWQARVSLHLPSMNRDSLGLGDRSSPRAQVLLQELQGRWHIASARCNAALDEIDRLAASWNELYRAREDAERQLVSVLSELASDVAAQLNAAAGVHGLATANSSVMRVSLTAQKAGRSSSAVSAGAAQQVPVELIDLNRRHLRYHLLGERPPVEIVESWWAEQSAQTKQRLINKAPRVIGNLDGVDIADRVLANRVSARGFADAKGISAGQRDYFNRVASGEVNLVVSDPDRSRVVEMIGHISSRTEHVITYVPGTGAQMKHYYGGEVQQVAEFLEQRSSDSAVVFVYKDGAWASWAGANSNTNYEFVQGLGEQVARFQEDVLDREENLRGTSKVAIGHSAGMTIISGAELAGAQFDRVLSLGGAYMLDGWAPSPKTNYFHFQYDNDVINRIDGGRTHTPHELRAVFEPNIFPSEGKAEMQSHSRIAEGPKTNNKPLAEMVRASGLLADQ